MSGFEGFDRGALFYPYIHVRDENWLKATLLAFPYLQRMVPQDFTVNDNAVAQDFAASPSRAGPMMLDAAEIDDGSAGDSQWKLANRLQEDVEAHGPAFIERFSREAALRDRPDGANAFQIGSGKLLGLLSDFRHKHPEMFWEPDIPVRGGAEWVGVHPVIGEAIMTATAAQIARTNSLDIVTDQVAISEAAVSGDVDVIYDRVVHGKPAFSSFSKATKVNDLCRLFIHSRFDLSGLSPAEIAEMNAAGADLAALKQRLARVLAGMPDVLTRELYDGYLQGALKEAIGEWQEEAASLSGFFNRLFGGAALDAGEDYLKDVAKEVAPAAAVGLGAALVSNLPGLVVGLAFHAGKSAYGELTQKSRGDFRYVSRLPEKSGGPKGHTLAIAQPATAAE